ncbi:MAG TPA: Ig-like domain-containing protein [Gemmatimonadaceae bacterium]|nr:Ig-like domain-containing protein [Gemmatimonadaceae bacterium]
MTLSRSIMAVAVLAVAGCGGAAVTGAKANCTDTLIGVVVSPATATMAVGDTERFHAYKGATCTAGVDSVHIRWSSSAPDRATVDSLTGLATALSKGNVVLTATYTLDRTVAGAATVTIGP